MAMLMLTLLSGGCETVSRLATSSWHTKCGWKAGEYFSDPQVIALCSAIEAGNLEEIDRLVATGADVNVRGKGNMTPLLWAFPDNQLARFTRLLEHGADPNVIVESDFNSRGGIHPGHSVLHLAAGSKFIDHFRLAMQHGGDPSLLDGKTGESLAHVIVKASISSHRKRERLQLLIERDMNLNHLSNHDTTPVMDAVSWFGQYDIALMLLDAGADPLVYQARSNQKLVHFVVREEQRHRPASEESLAYYLELSERLEGAGESLNEARQDVNRWMEWGRVYPAAKARDMLDHEVAERIARQKAEASR